MKKLCVAPEASIISAMTIDCSIVIVTFNTRELTLACIRDLIDHPAQRRCEIIVVDNASSDGTAEFIKQQFPSVNVLSQTSNGGFSKGCNTGAKQAKGPYLCFLNSDTMAAGQALDPLMQWMDNHPDCAVVGPEFRSETHDLIQMSWGWDPILFNELIQQYFAPYSLRRSAYKRRIVDWLQRKTRPVQILCGACLVVRREAFELIGGFDERFELYFEDSDLCRRLRENGKRIVFYADAHVIHHLGQSTKESWSLTPLVYRQSQIYFYRKHGPAGSIFFLKIYLILRWIRLWVKSFFMQGDTDRIRTYLKLFWVIIREKEKILLSGHYFSKPNRP